MGGLGGESEYSPTHTSRPCVTLSALLSIKLGFFAAFLLVDFPEREVNPWKEEARCSPCLLAVAVGLGWAGGMAFLGPTVWTTDAIYINDLPVAEQEEYTISQCPLGGRCSLEIDPGDSCAEDLTDCHLCLFEQLPPLG